MSNENNPVVLRPADESIQEAPEPHPPAQFDRVIARSGDRSGPAKSNPTMPQQGLGCAPGNQTFPQKLVQLVGHRNPRACDPFLRPHLTQATALEK